MNIFSSKSSLVGEAPILRLNRNFYEFFDLARELRVRLGSQAYLLDRYIMHLLEGTNETEVISAVQASYDGDRMAMNSVIRSILRCEETHKEYPFYQKAKAFIDSHPLPYREKETNYSIYCSLLYADFLELAAERYECKLKATYDQRFDIIKLQEDYQQICDILGSETEMEQLNLLFRQRFLVATAMQVYLQCVNNQLMNVLTYRDAETQRQVFQLILDEQIGYFNEVKK